MTRCPKKRPLPRQSHGEGGFTLLELLVVVGLIAAFSFFLAGGLAGGANSATLQSAQATVANLIAVARVKAMATGQPARVLVHVGPADTAQPARFLRYLVLQVQTADGWRVVADAYLPDGVYVVPGNFTAIPAGLFTTDGGGLWVRADGATLRSTALRQNQITAETINSPELEQWAGINFAATGTTAQAGDIVLTAGKVRAPGSYAAGESPVELHNPEEVRGVALSAYGVPVLINSRSGF